MLAACRVLLWAVSSGLVQGASAALASQSVSFSDSDSHSAYFLHIQFESRLAFTLLRNLHPASLLSGIAASRLDEKQI